MDSLELAPGGAFVTRMSEDGTEWHPHVDAVFLVIEEGTPTRIHECGQQLLASGPTGPGGDDHGDHPR